MISSTALPACCCRWLAALAACAALLLAGCTGNTLLTKRDYQRSVSDLSGGNIESARENFPKGEDHTFITTEEKAYLDLLNGQVRLDGLKRYRDLADDRIRYKISREIQDFFYVSTPEGYYASEHEIIWMHLLLSWGYSKLGQYEKACVEARRANFLLEAPWSAEGHFDDPTLRVILATVWSMCGSWEDAQVAFRAAAKLDPGLTWAQTLADKDRPPRNLIVVFGGVGPDPYWDPNLELNPLRGARHLGFKPQGLRSPLFVNTGGHLEALQLTPGSAPWYQRHLVRDNEIHDLIGDTHYALDSSAELGLHAVKTTAGVVVWIAAATAGVAGGVLVADLCIHTNCGEGALLIFFLPIAGFTYGHQKYNEIEGESQARLAYQTDPSNFYRFVRFLPEYAWVGWNDEELGDSVELDASAEGIPIKQGTAQIVGAKDGVPRVYLGFVPDVFPPENKPAVADISSDDGR